MGVATPFHDWIGTLRREANERTGSSLIMSESPSITPTNVTAPGSPVNMEVLTPRIDALRNSMGKDFGSSANRRAARKPSLEGKDREYRKAMVEGLITARRSGNDSKVGRRSSLDESQGGHHRSIAGYVSLDDFESFKRTIEARMQSMEEALEQKDDENAELHAAISTKSGEKKSSPKQNTSPSKPMSAVPALNLGAPSSPGSKANKSRPAMSPLASSSKAASG